jgi:hypothetical protein
MSREPKVEHSGPKTGREISPPVSRPSTLDRIYPLAFGLFLGLCIWKFGNPVILDSKIDPPATLSELWRFAWPTHWANWILLLLAVASTMPALAKPSRWPGPKWLWLPPLLWLGWQFVSASHSVDAGLTATTLWQFTGCVACFFMGAFLFSGRRATACLLIGVLAAFTFCLIRAVDQRVIEFPQTRQLMQEGERAGWTNIPPETLLELKRDHTIITTNGVDVPNPAFLEKINKGRAYGTLVYPNALAGLILLLWPASLALVFGANNLRPAVRTAAIATALFLGGAAFYWSGSKLGWLVAMAVGGLYLLRLTWPFRLKLAAIAAVVVLGLGIFAVRFHGYFAAGATSAGARFDYWRVALQTTENNPLLGTGPGTFQRPYEQHKPPGAEMARLAHNDYLEQFSDSGIPGGLFYGSWIAMALVTVGRRIWKTGNHVAFAIFAGALGWFIQGIGEFSLYIPALAWTAFTLLGWLLARAANPFDNKPATG